MSNISIKKHRVGEQMERIGSHICLTLLKYGSHTVISGCLLGVLAIYVCLIKRFIMLNFTFSQWAHTIFGS